MNNNDERDYAEEQANRRIGRDELSRDDCARCGHAADVCAGMCGDVWTLTTRAVADGVEPATAEQREIADVRHIVYVSRALLAQLLIRQCPGPHVYGRAGGGLPGYCSACGYTVTGRYVGGGGGGGQ